MFDRLFRRNGDDDGWEVIIEEPVWLTYDDVAGDSVFQHFLAWAAFAKGELADVADSFLWELYSHEFAAHVAERERIGLHCRVRFDGDGSVRQVACFGNGTRRRVWRPGDWVR